MCTLVRWALFNVHQPVCLYDFCFYLLLTKKLCGNVENILFIYIFFFIHKYTIHICLCMQMDVKPIIFILNNSIETENYVKRRRKWKMNPVMRNLASPLYYIKNIITFLGPHPGSHLLNSVFSVVRKMTFNRNNSSYDIIYTYKILHRHTDGIKTYQLGVIN